MSKAQKAKLLLPHCDKCEHKWHARYRRNKLPLFYCPQCGRRHPRWSAKDIADAERRANDLFKKINFVECSVAG